MLIRDFYFVQRLSSSRTFDRADNDIIILCNNDPVFDVYIRAFPLRNYNCNTVYLTNRNINRNVYITHNFFFRIDQSGE